MSETFLPELPQELWRAGRLELAHGVRQFLQIVRVASAGLGQYLAEVESRGAKDLFGYGSTVSWFAEVAGLSWGEARPVVNQAIAVNPTRAVDGTEVPAVAPATGVLAAEGGIGAERIAQILEILGKIPPDTSVEDRE
ncbi:HNH endonuclease, partial [Amycolatopsis speibonae]